MREHLFRAKCKETGEWQYGDKVTEINGSTIKTFIHNRISPINFNGDSLTSGLVLYEVDPETVGQYTGVHDDSEEQEELYDSDVVEVEYEGQKHICKVQYCGSGYMFVADSLPDGYLWLSDFIEFDRKYCWAEGTKKLGNVYDNPDLLGVSNFLGENEVIR